MVRTGNSATRFSGTGESDVLVGVVSWVSITIRTLIIMTSFFQKVISLI